MPWIAIHEGERKAPRQVPKQVDVECPTCGDRMRVRSRSSDGRARHFYHVENIGGGEGGDRANCESVGESDIHMKWKSLAADRLEQEFSERVETCEMEHQLDAPVSEKEQRYADAAVVFSEPDEQLGRGLVVEVQHKNEEKDIAKTTADYIDQDFAVAWVDGDDFTESQCQLAEIDFRTRAREAIWPDFIPEEPRWRAPANAFDQVQERNTISWTDELIDAAGEVTLPTDWVDQTALEIWRKQPWESVFRPAQTDRYQLHGLLGQGMTGKQLPLPTMPPEFVDTVTQSLWEGYSWELLFDPPKSSMADFSFRDYTRTATVDFTPWFSEALNSDGATQGVIWALRQKADAFIELDSSNSSRSCQDCGSTAAFNIYAPNQGYNGFYCRGCLRDA